MWMERLEWSGKKGFNKEELTEWMVGGKVAGSYKTYKNLSVSAL
jgi:cathepsin A (carboxypeptidase C)